MIEGPNEKEEKISKVNRDGSEDRHDFQVTGGMQISCFHT